MPEWKLETDLAFLGPMKVVLDGAKVPLWVAGGAFAALITRERVRDYDVFSPDPPAAVADLEARGFRSTYADQHVNNLHRDKVKAQVVLGFPFPSMEETIAAFDFTVCCAAFDGQRFVCHERFYRDVAHRRLVVNALPRPLSSMSRALRYAHKGYWLCPVGLSAILRAIQDAGIDWNNPAENQIDFYPDGSPKFRGLD